MGRVLATLQVEKYLRQHSIFRTRILCGGKESNFILDGDSSENIVSKECRLFTKLRCRGKRGVNDKGIYT